LKCFHGKYLDADIDFVADVERHVLHEHVERYESVLAELDLDRDPVLDKVRLVVGGDGLLAGGLNFFLLLRGFHRNRLADQIIVRGYPVADLGLLPLQRSEFLSKALVHRGRAVEHLALLALFLRLLCLALRGVYRGENPFDFGPQVRLMD